MGAIPLYWPIAARSFFVSYCFSLAFRVHYMGWHCGAGVLRLIGCTSFSPSLALPTFFNNIINNNNKSTRRL